MIREWETCEDDGHEHPEDEAFGFCYSNIRDLFVNVAVGNYGHEEEGDRQPATVKPYKMVSMRRLRGKEGVVLVLTTALAVLAPRHFCSCMRQRDRRHCCLHSRVREQDRSMLMRLG